MANIYRSSFKLFRDCFFSLLALATLIEVLIWFLKPRSETAVTFVGLTIVAYLFHRYFLFGETLSLRTQTPAEGVPALKFGWFILISGGLVLVPVGLALMFSFSMTIRPGTALLLVMLVPCYLLMLSMFGLALPAVVARDSTYMVSQGLRATFQTMWRLVLGPGVVGLRILELTVGVGLLLEGVPDDDPVILGYFIAIRTLGFLTTIVAVAVLCEMYRMTRPGALAWGPGQQDQTPS